MKRIVILLILNLLLFTFTNVFPTEYSRAEETSNPENNESEKVIAPNYYAIQPDFYLYAELENKSDSDMVFNVTAEGAKQMIDTNSNVAVIDVRTYEEYSSGHIGGALNIPFSEFSCESCVYNNLYDCIGDNIIVYDQNGEESEIACRYIYYNGFQNVYNIISGLEGWIAQGFTVTTDVSLDVYLDDQSNEIECNICGLDDELDYPVMHPDSETMEEWIEKYNIY